MVGKNDAKIIISGHGKFQAEVVAIGPYSRAEKIVTTAGEGLAAKEVSEMKTKLDELMAAIKKDASKLSDPKPVVQLVERVAGELNRKSPDKLTLKGFLTAIAEETKAVASIADAAMALKAVIAGLL